MNLDAKAIKIVNRFIELWGNLYVAKGSGEEIKMDLKRY